MADTVVRFVKQKGANQDLLQKAYNGVSALDSNCMWMTEEECLEIKDRIRKAVFVFDKFEGDAFNNVAQYNNRIYGAPLIIACTKDGTTLPKTHHPVHNFSMKNIIICCTNVEKTLREEISKYIEYMCGEVSKDFHDKVTHLIAAEVGSKKYVVAASMKKRIMSPEWVQKVWEDSQTMFCSGDNDNYMEYRCKVFAGCVITVSGLDNRAEARDIIEEEGGKYTGEMKLAECTHLVCNKPEGQKYQFAKKWKLPIVLPAWLFDSVDAGYCLDISMYKVTDSGPSGAHTSTPTGGGTTKGPRLSTYGPDISCVSVDQVNETAFNQTRNPQDLTLNQSLQQPQEMDTAELDELDCAKIRAGMFLDGCKIFLSGFTGTRLEKLRKLINMGGGTRLSQINETVTHMVLGNRVEDHIKRLQEGNIRPCVVSSAWIVACAVAGNQVSEDMYRTLDLLLPEPMTPVCKPAKPRTSIVPKPAPPAEASKTDDMQELLSQYLPQNTDTTNESALVRAMEAMEGIAPEKTNEETQEEEMTQDPTQETMQEGGIFAGKTLVLIGLEHEDAVDLTRLIEEDEGKVVDVRSRGVPDFAVVPFHGTEVKITVSEIVTNAFIRTCHEDNELYATDANPMFTPLTFRAKPDLLTGCVLSISGYSGVERDILLCIGEELGATCQEYLVRAKQPKKKLLGSTHLVVNDPSGSKYKAAKDWGLPAVDRGWLYACARTGKWVSEERYAVDREQDETADDTTLVEMEETKPENGCKEGDESDGELNTSAKENGVSMVPAPTTPIQQDMEVDKELSKPAVTELKQQERRESTDRLPNHRVKALITQNKNESPRGQKQTDKSGIDSPSKFQTKGVMYRPDFDLTDVMKALQTPEIVRKKKRERKSSTPLTVLAERNLDIALKNSMHPGKNPLPVTPAVKRSTINQTILQEPTGPLRGVVVAVSKKLSAEQSDINDIVSKLGGDYRWTYDNSCTHFVFKGRRNDTSKEFRTAREHGKKIVSPLWIKMCEEQVAHVDESLFPHDYNPNLSLAVTSTKAETPTNRLSRRSTRSRLKTDETASPPLRASKRTRSKVAETAIDQMDEPPKKVPSPPKEPVSSPKKVLGKRKTPESKVTEDQEFNPHDKTCSDDEMAAACNGFEEEQQAKKKARMITPATQPANTLAREAFVDDITNLMAATKTYSGKTKRKSRRTDSLSGEAAEEQDSKQISLSRSSTKSDDHEGTPASSRGERRGTRSRTRLQKPSEMTQAASQMVEVTWDDPQARIQQEKLAEELAKNSESFSPTRAAAHLTSDEDNNNHDTTDEEIAIGPLNPIPNAADVTVPLPEEMERIETPDPPQLAVPTAIVPPPQATNMMTNDTVPEEDMDETVDESKPPRKFLFSGLSPEEKTDYGALIEQLGGQISDAAYYDPKCTHLVVGMPTRNEKYLACVASGKWILHKSYMEACRQAQVFVDEDEYEWGSESTLSTIKGKPSATVKLAKAAHRWRRQVVEGAGAFSDWSCVLITDTKKEDGLIRLLQAGGAKVMGTRPPFTNLEDMNFAFMELHKVKQKVDLDEFLSAGVHCMKPEYIANYLTDDPIPKPQQYYIAEVARSASGDSGARKRKPSGAETPNSKRSRHF